MEDPRPDDPQAVPERLVAWHNRHPLARRLSAAQVQSVGYVAVPFLPPAGAPPPPAAPARAAPPAAAGAAGHTLRERAQARAQQGDPDKAAGGAVAGAARPAKAAKTAPGRRADPAARPARGPLPKPAFTEDFIAPLRPRQVARWLARHGQADADLARGVPVRRVTADPERAPRKSDVQPLYAWTAMVEVGGKRIRPLLSLSTPGAVLGTRLWSLPRVAAAAGLACSLLLVVGAAAWWWPGAETPALQAAAPPTAASALPLQAASAAFPSIRPTLVEPAAPVWPPLPGQRAAAHTPQAEMPHGLPQGTAAPAPASAPVLAPEPAPAFATATPEPDAAAPAGPAPLDPRAPGLAAAAAAGGVAAALPAATPAPSDRPVDVEPSLGRIQMPDLGLPRPDRARPRSLPPTPGLPTPEGPVQRAGPLPLPGAEPGAPGPAPAAVAAVAAAAAPLGPPVPVAAAPPGVQRVPAAGDGAGAPASTASPPTPPTAAPVPAGPPVFALSTRLLRTRAESELTMAAMRSLLLTAGYRDVQVEALPVGEDWRVVGWPFAQRAQADRARGLLAARGMRLEVVDF